MRVLVTGGCGYIGSHTCVELLNNNYEVIIVDNLSNSKREVIDKIEEITSKKVKFYEMDLCDKEKLRKVFLENEIDEVIHFAGYKAVGESVKEPLKYFRNNFDSTITLLELMNEYNVKRLVFSSSATVYGNPEKLPITEDEKLSVTNPYGRTKLYIEGMLSDLYNSDKEWSIIALRYFNPVGAHSSYLIGENPNGIPNNLMPYIVKVAIGELSYLNIFGADYNTKDGTGVRDYIHVVDLANGHLKALEYIEKNNGIEYINLGTGHGYSVLEMVETFSMVNNIEVPYEIVDRRAGDIAECYADTKYAKELLGWEAKLGLDDMVRSAYNYAILNKS